MFFQWFVAPEGRQVGSLKQRARSQLAKWEMNSCTPLWRESHFQVNMYKTHHAQTTFGSCDVEKVHSVVARSTFRSQNVQSTPCSDHFWKLRCRKSERRCGVMHISKSSVKNWRVRSTRSTFGRSDVVLPGRRKGLCTVSKGSRRVGFCSISKTMAGAGHLKRICKDAFSVAGAVRETCSSELLGGRGADFLREVAFWSIRSSVLGRWFRVTGAALRMTWHQFFVAGPVLLTGGVEKSQNALVRGLSALHSTFHFWRKSRRIALFLMLPTSKIEEVSQSYFVFDVVKFKHSRIEEVSQNSFVFKLADRQI